MQLFVYQFTNLQLIFNNQIKHFCINKNKYIHIVFNKTKKKATKKKHNSALNNYTNHAFYM